MAVSFVIKPLTFVYVSVCMNQCSLSVCLITHPLSIVFRAVLPNLFTIAIFHAHEDLTSVNSTVAQSDGSKGLSELGVLHFWSDSSISLMIVITVHLRHHLLTLVDCLTIYLRILLHLSILLLFRIVLIVVVNAHVSLLLLLELLLVCLLVKVRIRRYLL